MKKTFFILFAALLALTFGALRPATAATPSDLLRMKTSAAKQQLAGELAAFRTEVDSVHKVLTEGDEVPDDEVFVPANDFNTFNALKSPQDHWDALQNAAAGRRNAKRANVLPAVDANLLMTKWAEAGKAARAARMPWAQHETFRRLVAEDQSLYDTVAKGETELIARAKAAKKAARAPGAPAAPAASPSPIASPDAAATPAPTPAGSPSAAPGDDDGDVE